MMNRLRKWLHSFLLALPLLSIGIASAQTQPATFTISATTSPCALIRTSQQATVAIIVSGTFSGTLTPSVLIYGGAAAAGTISVTPQGGSMQPTITATGTYTAVVSGFAAFELCPTAWTSGSATVQLFVGPPGGGSGATSNVSVTNTPTVIATQPNGALLQMDVANNQVTATGSLTSASSSTCTTNNGVNVATPGAGSVGIQIVIAGATNATTLGFYYSMDGVNYVAVVGNMVTPFMGGIPITGTVGGVVGTYYFQANLPVGTADFMVCGPTTASSTATITLQASLTNSNFNPSVTAVGAGAPQGLTTGGCEYRQTSPGLSTATVAYCMFDAWGDLITTNFRRSNLINQAITITNSSAAATLFAAQGAGTFTDLTAFTATCTAQATGVAFTITLTGGTSAQIYDFNTGSTTALVIQPPLVVPWNPALTAAAANTAWTVTLSVATVTCHFTAVAELAKAN
jgi:hypothetical protein